MKVVPGEPPMYSGFLDCVKKMYAKEGLRGFYKVTHPLFSLSLTLTLPLPYP